MKKTAKMLLMATAFVLVLTGAVIYGERNKNSYKNDVAFDSYLANKDLRVLYHHYPFDKQYDIYGNGDRIRSLSELENQSEIIIKARLNPGFSRKIYEECVLSGIEVLKVYKGKLEVGNRLTLFEPVNCTEAKTAMYCSEGYSPMRPDKEYLLFLKPLKNSLFGKDDVVYIPSTVTYSKFAVTSPSVNQLSKRALEGSGTPYRYCKLKDQEVFLYDKKMYDLYILLKVGALKRYQ